MANQACKEPLGSVSSSELLASLSPRAVDSSGQDGFGDTSGVTLALPAAAASGQNLLGSRLPSLPANRLLQDDVIRQMAPLPQAAASYVVSMPVNTEILERLMEQMQDVEPLPSVFRHMRASVHRDDVQSADTNIVRVWR